MRRIEGGVEIELVRGDITNESTDAIVNAANLNLILGGGVAGAIRKKGGPSIQKECDMIGPIPVGTAAITGGGNLHARYVIHAVGPRMGEGDEGRKLTSCVIESLRLADREHLRSISFPAISTGIFGVPPDLAAPSIVRGIREYIEKGTGIERIRVILFEERMWDDFMKAMEDIIDERDR
jgi:O-acetyl-ADP-ribose deacetylase (regulator of RNase III)